MKKPQPSVLLISFTGLWGFFLIIYFFDLAFFYGVLVFLYELIIGNIIIFFNYSFSILRYAIPYLFIFFILCLFNVRYKGFIKLKFFGIDLQQYRKNPKINYLIFFFKEHTYVILFMLNFICIIILLYYIMHKDFWISGIIISCYSFIGLSMYIKKWLIQNNYYNKRSFNICLNMILAAVFSVYLNEIGDSIEHYLGFKINIGEFLYGFFQQKDKLLLKVKEDQMLNNYKWWRQLDLYKNQKASFNYLYLKNQIVNKKLLTDITQKNKIKYLNNNIENIINNIKNDYKIQHNNIKYINFKNNNIYTDKNMVYYTNEKFDNQADYFKKLNYSKYLENKKFKLYLLNMKGVTAGDFVPKGNKNNFNIFLLLDKEKEHTIYNLKKVLLEKKLARYTYLHNKSYFKNKYNNYNNYKNLLDKNLNTKSLYYLKFTKNSVWNLIKEKPLYKTKIIKVSVFVKWKQYIHNLKIVFKDRYLHNLNWNHIVYSYNQFLNWWAKQHYIINNIFKDYNVKKYVSLTKYNFQGKNVLYNLFQKDAVEPNFKPNKLGKIHDIKFKLKLTNNVDRNFLYFKYYKTTFNNKIKVLNFIKILNNNSNIIKTIDNKVMFISQKFEISKKTFFEVFLYDWVKWTDSDLFKYLYFKYYPPKTSVFSNFKLKNAYSSLVLYSENYNNKYLSTFNTRIEHLKITEYQKIYRSFSIYSYFFNNYMNFDFNNKINNIELKMNNTKQIYSIFFKDNSYNNKNLFSYFQYTYVFNNRLNATWDAAMYKNYITQIATNVDTNTSSNLYYQQFLFKTADYLTFYYSWNKMSFGQVLNHLNQLKIFFNKYSILESYLSNRKAYYNFNSKMLNYLDRSIYLKAESDAINYEERLIYEKLMDLESHQNRINICNLAYDTSIAMDHEDLDTLIDDIESFLLVKGEYKSCTRVAYGLMHALNDLNYRSERNLNLLEQITEVALEDFEVQCIESYKIIKDFDQQQRFLIKNYTEDEIALLYNSITDENDKEEFADILEFQHNLALKDLIIQKQLGPKYIELEKAWGQLNVLDIYCLGLEELLKDIADTREADQAQLLIDIENDKNLKLLKEIALKRDIWIEENYYYKLNQVKKETQKFIYKDWDLYNQNRFKNEILTFKKKK